MLSNLFSTLKQVETFCSSCNSFYLDFVSNVNTTKFVNGEKLYHATCYKCLNDKDDFETYLIWQSLIFVNSKLSFNLSPIDKFYN